MKKIIAVVVLLLLPKFAAAQTEPHDTLTAKTDTADIFHRVTVISNQNDAKVYLDTTYIGVTPVVNFGVKEGSHVIKVFSTEALKNWEAEIETFEIYVDRDTTLSARFRRYYYFSTEPFGARVSNADSLLGITPLRFFSYDKLTGSLVFKKKNYKDYIYDLDSYNFETGAFIKLIPKGLEPSNDDVYKNRGTQFKTKRHIVPIIALGAASIAGGIFAYSFKNNANEDYDKYLLTGNQEQLDSSNRNDNYFIVSLILMQAAIGGLIYFLFFD